MRSAIPSLVLLTMLALACRSAVEPATFTGSLMVANATNGWIDVDVDGRRQLLGLSVNGLSHVLSMNGGLHQIRVSHGGGIGGAVERMVDIAPELPSTLVAYPLAPSSTTPDMALAVLVDTGAYAPGGKSKLRVANLSARAGDVEIWRRQPDLREGSRITAAFPTGAASPYLQGDAGVWEVWLAAPNGGARTLSSGPIQIPSGERRTVLVVDTDEGPRFVVLGA